MQQLTLADFYREQIRKMLDTLTEEAKNWLRGHIGARLNEVQQALNALRTLAYITLAACLMNTVLIAILILRMR